jgi:hypothetical protein
VLGDEPGGGGFVINRQGDDLDASVRQGGTGALEGAQLGVAVGTPGAAAEQHHAELAGERVRHRDGRAAGDGEPQFRESVTGVQQGHGQAPYRYRVGQVPGGTFGVSATCRFSGLGHMAVSGGGKPVAHQRAGLGVRADQRRRAAGLVEQVADLAEIVHAVLAQQREHVRGRQAGPAEFTVLYLASGDQDPGQMVNESGHPVVPPGERDEAVRDQEGDQRDRAGGERRRRSGHGPADDRADRDRDREVERAELGERAPLSKPQADDGHREHQHRLDRDPAQTARPSGQLQQPPHPLGLSGCTACLGDSYQVRNSPITAAISSTWVSRAK